MIKAIVFDCFGVVLGDGFFIAYRHFNGDPEKDRDFLAKLILDVNKGRIESSVPIIAKHLGVTEDEWKAANYSNNHIDYDMLEYAKELGKDYKVAMLSNVSQAGLRRFFKPGFLERYFNPVVESYTIGYAKPEAQAYEYVADKLGVRLDECVMIDDREDYILGAQGVGMKTVLYQNLEQLKAELDKILA